MDSPTPLPKQDTTPKTTTSVSPISSYVPPEKKNVLASKLYAFLSLLIIVGGLFSIVLLVSQVSNPKPVTENRSQAKSTAQPLSLTVESPTDGTVVSDGTVTVKGKTGPNTSVVFYTENDQNSAISDETGSFLGKVNLTKGLNTLIVTAYGENGLEKSVNMDIVYDTQSSK